MKVIDEALYDFIVTEPLVTVLLADNEAVYRGVAPEGAGFPFIVFFKSSGTRSWALAGETVYDFLYTVKAVHETEDAAEAQDIDEELNTLLNDSQPEVEGFTNVSIRRESDVEFTETQEHRQFEHVGGIYRIRLTL